MMICGGFTKDGLSNSQVFPCGVCSLRVKANSVLCVQHGNRIHGRYCGVKRVSQSFQEMLLAGMVNGIVERRWSWMKSCVMNDKSLHILVTG